MRSEWYIRRSFRGIAGDHLTKGGEEGFNGARYTVTGLNCLIVELLNFRRLHVCAVERGKI
jgi:hypothetical protein